MKRPRTGGSQLSKSSQILSTASVTPLGSAVKTTSNFDLSPTSRSFKDFVLKEDTLRGPYHDLKAFTETIQRKLGTIGSNLRSGIPSALEAFSEEQKSHLANLLKQLATGSNAAYIFALAASVDCLCPDTETQFSQQCMRALKKVLHEMPRLQIHNFSSDIIKSIKVDSIAEFFDAMTSGQPTRKMMSTTNDPVVSDYDHQRVLVLYTREAFSSPYEPTHAMTAFLEYLDVQWLSMIKAWVPNEGTRQSRGGTIVQSSCAGKSRLVERLGEHLLAPSINFQASYDETGMASGFPTGDSDVIRFFKAHSDAVPESRYEREYFEQRDSESKKNKYPDPRPLWWTMRNRIVTLAFIVGLFRRLGEIISLDSITSRVDMANEIRPECDSRAAFLRAAIKYANDFLSLHHETFNSWETEIQTKTESEEQSVLTNGMLARALVPLVSHEICIFFDILERLEIFNRGPVAKHLVTKHLKTSYNPDLGRIKLVLMIDEAKHLVDLHFYNAFRWIIDEVVELAYVVERPNRVHPLPFMVFFLGTNSKVADFLPPDEDSSERYYSSYIKVPQPFTALDWDIGVAKNPGLRYPILTYDSIAEMTWLCRWGRPYWQAQWSCSLRIPAAKLTEANSIITAAENRLHHRESKGGFAAMFRLSARDEKSLSAADLEDNVLTCSAILGVLAIINMDFTSPKRASALVASRLRWAVGCDRKRTYLLTTYPSEPILAEAAFRLLFTELPNETDRHRVLKKILNTIADEVENGDYDTGGDGEFVARILCILARRWALESYYRGVKVNTLQLSPPPREDPLLYSHRPTPVTIFLRSLFQETWANVMEVKSPEVWRTLHHSYVNFIHFSEEVGHKNAFNSLTAEGLRALFLRGCAIQCRQGQVGIDLVIPMVVIPPTESLSSQVSLSHISAIIVQVKNKNRDARDFSCEFLDKKQFDIRHIQGLSANATHPYVGIWMSLGAKDDDFSVEGYHQNFKPDWDRQTSSPSCKSPRATRHTSRLKSMYEVVGTNEQTVTRHSGEPEPRPLKKQKQDCVPLDRLVIRGRGFWKIYNHSFPLDVLYRLVERHQFSTSVSGLSFPSDLIREKAMRGVWKLSSNEKIDDLQLQLATMEIDE